MAYTVPNQRIINIHRAPLGNSFLGINNENMKNAARILSASAFKLYIYLAANKDDFKLALSPAAIQKEMGMPRSTFYDQFKVLEGLGFLVRSKGNLYHFYEIPNYVSWTVEDVRDSFKSTEEENTTAVISSPVQIYNTPTEEKQIYINDKEELINIPKVKESFRTERQPSYSELRSNFHF